MKWTGVTSLVFTSVLLILLCSPDLIEGSPSHPSGIGRQRFHDDDGDLEPHYQLPASTHSNIFIAILIALFASLLAGSNRLAVVFTFTIGVWFLLGQQNQEQNHETGLRSRTPQYVAIDHGRIHTHPDYNVFRDPASRRPSAPNQREQDLLHECGSPDRSGVRELDRSPVIESLQEDPVDDIIAEDASLREKAAEHVPALNLTQQKTQTENDLIVEELEKGMAEKVQNVEAPINIISNNHQAETSFPKRESRMGKTSKAFAVGEARNGRNTDSIEKVIIPADLSKTFLRAVNEDPNAIGYCLGEINADGSSYTVRQLYLPTQPGDPYHVWTSDSLTYAKNNRLVVLGWICIRKQCKWSFIDLHRQYEFQKTQSSYFGIVIDLHSDENYYKRRFFMLNENGLQSCKGCTLPYDDSHLHRNDEPLYKYAPHSKDMGIKTRLIDHRTPVVIPGGLMRGFGSLVNDFVTVGYLLGRLTSDGRCVVTQLYLPPNSGLLDSYQLQIDDMLDDIKRNDLTVLGWIRSHQPEDYIWSTADHHRQYEFQNSQSNFVGIIFIPETLEFSVCSLSQKGLQVCKDCILSISDSHEHPDPIDLFDNISHYVIDENLTSTYVDRRLAQTPRRSSQDSVLNESSGSQPAQISCAGSGFNHLEPNLTEKASVPSIDESVSTRIETSPVPVVEDIGPQNTANTDVCVLQDEPDSMQEDPIIPSTSNTVTPDNLSLVDPIQPSEGDSDLKTVEAKEPVCEEIQEPSDKESCKVEFPFNVPLRYRSAIADIESTGYLLGDSDGRVSLITHIYFPPLPEIANPDPPMQCPILDYAEKNGLKVLGWIHKASEEESSFSCADFHREYGSDFHRQYGSEQLQTPVLGIVIIQSKHHVVLSTSDGFTTCKYCASPSAVTQVRSTNPYLNEVAKDCFSDLSRGVDVIDHRLLYQYELRVPLESPKPDTDLESPEPDIDLESAEPDIANLQRSPDLFSEIEQSPARSPAKDPDPFLSRRASPEITEQSPVIWSDELEGDQNLDDLQDESPQIIKRSRAIKPAVSVSLSETIPKSRSGSDFDSLQAGRDSQRIRQNTLPSSSSEDHDHTFKRANFDPSPPGRDMQKQSRQKSTVLRYLSNMGRSKSSQALDSAVDQQIPKLKSYRDRALLQPRSDSPIQRQRSNAGARAPVIASNKEVGDGSRKVLEIQSLVQEMYREGPKQGAASLKRSQSFSSSGRGNFHRSTSLQDLLSSQKRPDPRNFNRDADATKRLSSVHRSFQQARPSSRDGDVPQTFVEADYRRNVCHKSEQYKQGTGATLPAGANQSDERSCSWRSKISKLFPRSKSTERPRPNTSSASNNPVSENIRNRSGDQSRRSSRTTTTANVR